MLTGLVVAKVVFQLERGSNSNLDWSLAGTGLGAGTESRGP